MNHKTAIVTGASSGIGLAIANRLIANNFEVHNWDIQETVESKANGSVFTRTDVRHPSDIEASARTFAAVHEKLDVLVCNSGVHRRNTLRTITEDEWDLVQDTNVKGVVFTVKHCMDLLKSSDKPRVVIMGSDQCFIAKPESLAYGTSKGAIAQLTRNIALELAQYDILVNAICPATIDTPLARRAFQEFAESNYNGNMEEALAWEAGHYPLNRIGQPEDVAELAHYLATCDNRFTTGGLYKIDGGLTLG